MASVGNLLAGWLALSQVNGASDGTSMKPSVTVDAQSLARVLSEFGRALDGFQQGEKAVDTHLCCGDRNASQTPRQARQVAATDKLKEGSRD